MSNFWKEPQNVIALGVTLISVCALIVSVTQTRIMIRQSELMDTQARASVRPILIYERYRAFDPQTLQLTDYQMSILNRGVGPASIDDVYVAHNGKVVRSWGSLFQRMNVHDSIPTYVTTEPLNNAVIQAGEEVVFLDLSDNLALARVINKSLDSIDMKILYSSIYGDQFELRRTEEGWVNEALNGEKRSYDTDSQKNQ